jgi:hypothetical protein
MWLKTALIEKAVIHRDVETTLGLGMEQTI